MAPLNASAKSLRSVIVVDPSFDSYRELAAAAHEGRISLHLRSSGAAALKLAGKVVPDAWIVAADLDDMAGRDFIDLLREQIGVTGPVWVTTTALDGVVQGNDEQSLRLPISCDELEALIDETAITAAPQRGKLAKFLALPVAGIGLATSLIIIALQAG